MNPSKISFSYLKILFAHFILQDKELFQFSIFVTFISQKGQTFYDPRQNFSSQRDSFYRTLQKISLQYSINHRRTTIISLFSKTSINVLEVQLKSLKVLIPFFLEFKILLHFEVSSASFAGLYRTNNP